MASEATKKATAAGGEVLSKKILFGYPLANFGTTLQMCLQMYFLLYFLTNVLQISGTAAATIIMVARIWDFINDPLMAVVVEKTRKPEKCLWWIRVATIPTVIFMILTYAAPNLSPSMRIVWASLTYVGSGMTQTAYSIPLSGLRPLLTSDGVQRARLATYNGVFSAVANLVIPVFTMPLVAWMQGMEIPQPYMIIAVIYGVIYIGTSFAGQKLLKGSERSDTPAAAQNAPKVSTKEMFSALVKNEVALLIFLVTVVKFIVSSIGSSTLVYYCQYNLGNTNIMSVTSAVQGVAGIFLVMLLVPLFKKFGNAGSAILACAVALFGCVVRFVTHDSSIVIYFVMSLLISLAGSLASNVMEQCLMDGIDYGEWKNGTRATTMIMSAKGIGTKFGLAFGTSIAGYVLGAVGFDGSLAVQPESSLNALFHLSVTSLVIMYALMILCFVFIWRIEKKLPQMKAEVAQRKLAAEAAKAE